MEEIIPGLWIGDLACALATDYLSLAGITHIVTAMKQQLPSPVRLPDGRRIEKARMHHVNIDDVDNAPILVHLPGAVDFIDEALAQQWLEDDEDTGGDEGGREQGAEAGEQSVSTSSASGSVTPPAGKRKGQWATTGEGTVLVHCQAGVSRSVAIVAAYLMRTRSMDVASALKLIQSRRCQADPNPGFRHQLELYESASCNVDVRNQRIRRFLMSQSSILKGDPIDDVLLSYYPSPFHSPANSSSSSLSNGFPGPPGLQFSTLDGGSGGVAGEGPEGTDSGSRTRRSSRANSSAGESSSARSSPVMSRQGSRVVAAAAAANEGSSRQSRNSKADGSTLLDLSKSPPMPINASELFDIVDGEQEDPTQQLIRERFSSVREDHEVLITINRGNLPGGVEKVKGNQGKGNGVDRLPKPHFRDLKLRCRMCRRELAARDHVVEHEAGRGKDAFDVRKREKDTEAKSREARTVREMGIEERFGAQTRVSSRRAADSDDEEGAEGVPQPQQSPAGARGTIQTAASLSAQLPPHLAALRQGKAIGGTGTSVTASDVAPPRKMLHSVQCSSYFVEPLAWMSALKLGEVAGRLECPNVRCGAKLGSWDWAGMQCACGAWVTPAFALHKSKVDEI